MNEETKQHRVRVWMKDGQYHEANAARVAVEEGYLLVRVRSGAVRFAAAPGMWASYTVEGLDD